MNKESLLTLQMLRERLHYNPETGQFTYKERPGNNALIGTIAGWQDKNGYIGIYINRYNYFAHRLAWLYMTGDWPPGNMDHIDGNPANNSWKNLRVVSHATNMENVTKARSHNKCGVLGVRRAPLNAPHPWSARIRVDYVEIHLGYFPTTELAHEAYLQAKRKYHKGCTI